MAEMSEFPEDTVVVHSRLGRGPYVPSVSTFVLKLETYLRMAKIPYKPKFHSTASKKGKTPWMSYNDEEVDDTELCIRFINEKFNVDLQRDFTPEQKADVFAYRTTIDEFLYWCGAYERFNNTSLTTLASDYNVPWPLMWYIRRKFSANMYGQGISRHTEEDIRWMTERALDALTAKLGDKPYLFGDKPTEADCALFGVFAVAKFQCPGYLQDQMTNKYAKLSDLVERLKSEYWPDWDECITHGHTKEATK